MFALQDEEIVVALQKGKLEVKGEFLLGSNYTFLAKVDYLGESLDVVYKPVRGERPLWDFPPASLARREVAAYLVSEALNWRLVPPTVFRSEGPFGAGSIQLFIQHDFEYHYFNFSTQDRLRLRPVALFDLLVNNADRKASHIILDPDQHIWLIDHGICFHVENKLRTVVWDFAGEPIPDDLLVDLIEFRQQLTPGNGQPSELVNALSGYLSQAEIEALARRADHLIAYRTFQNPELNRRPFPWPPV